MGGRSYARRGRAITRRGRIRELSARRSVAPEPTWDACEPVRASRGAGTGLREGRKADREQPSVA